MAPPVMAEWLEGSEGSEGKFELTRDERDSDRVQSVREGQGKENSREVSSYMTTHTHTHACMHAHTHTRAHTHTHKHTHTGTCAHAHTHTNKTSHQSHT